MNSVGVLEDGLICRVQLMLLLVSSCLARF
jgi:hypothetical protein